MATHRFVPDTYHNVIGSLSPALHIADGDTVITETLDAAGYDKHDINRISGPNPMNGPIFVEGAETGDSLKVEILAMVPTPRHRFYPQRRGEQRRRPAGRA